MQAKDYDSGNLFTVLRRYTRSGDQIDIIRAVFENSLYIFIVDYFKQVREFENGLVTADEALRIIEAADGISETERVYWTQEFILMRLIMLDYINSWKEYVTYFESRLAVKKDSVYPWPFQPADMVPEIYIMFIDEAGAHVHFLWLADARYRIIKRKFEKFIHGKNVEHLKRHQRDRLPPGAVGQGGEALVPVPRVFEAAPEVHCRCEVRENLPARPNAAGEDSGWVSRAAAPGISDPR
jgi:hypothetical protein